MALALSHTTVNALHAHAQSVWWSDLLGYHEDPADRSRDEEVARVLGLGATVVQDCRTDDGRGWVVLADPEDNEFCILRSDDERRAAGDL